MFLEPTCVFNSGGERCWSFAQQGKMAPIILTVTAPQVCVYLCHCWMPFAKKASSCWRQSHTKPQQGPMITLNDTGAYLPLVLGPGPDNSVTSFIWLISQAFNSYKKQRNYRHTEKSLCQTANGTVAFSLVPPLNLSLALSHCCQWWCEGKTEEMQQVSQLNTETHTRSHINMNLWKNEI